MKLTLKKKPATIPFRSADVSVKELPAGFLRDTFDPIFTTSATGNIVPCRVLIYFVAAKSLKGDYHR